MTTSLLHYSSAQVVRFTLWFIWNGALVITSIVQMWLKHPFGCFKRMTYTRKLLALVVHLDLPFSRCLLVGNDWDVASVHVVTAFKQYGHL